VEVSSQHRRLGVDLCKEGWVVLRKGGRCGLTLASGDGKAAAARACNHIRGLREDILYPRLFISLSAGGYW
jgi:hypothetical protein